MYTFRVSSLRFILLRSLLDFTDDVGVPDTLVTDGSGESTGRNSEF